MAIFVQPQRMNNHPQLSAWLDAVSTSFNAGNLIKITLLKPGQTAGDLKSIDIRPVTIKHTIKLSFTYHHKTRDIVKNHSLGEAQVLLTQLLTEIFAGARLHSAAADFALARQGENFNLVTGKATMQPAELTHNRAKNHLISSSGKHYLQALGLTDAQGHVLKTAQDKFRQINKYIEIVDGLIKNLPQRKLRIVDMGAGKGYLTFALYDHLTGTLKRDCEIIGVEFRPDLVKMCNEIAVSSHFDGLKFVEGTIAGYDCANADIVIALHACDTATDDAIAKAIKANAQIIVVAPCCHKQIRREMKASAMHGDLEFLLRFGTYQERLSEMITDSLRARLMEFSGYECNLFEFISDAHTPKNIMIVGKRLDVTRSDAATQKIAEDIAGAKQKFGIKEHQLERLLEL
jgi:SAM-dependent methyltransferase